MRVYRIGGSFSGVMFLWMGFVCGCVMVMVCEGAFGAMIGLDYVWCVYYIYMYTPEFR